MGFNGPATPELAGRAKIVELNQGTRWRPHIRYFFLDLCASQQYNNATQRELSRFVALLGRFLP